MTCFWCLLCALYLPKLSTMFLAYHTTTFFFLGFSGQASEEEITDIEL